MKRRQMLVLFAIAVLFLSLLNGCAKSSEQKIAVAEKIAVVDLAKVLKAHKLYPAWQMAVDNEIATQKLQDHHVALVKEQAGFIGKMRDLQQAGQVSFYQADFAVKMSEAHLAERERLKDIERQEKQRIEENSRLRYAAVEEEYKLPMFNLKMKIEGVKPLPYQREQAQAQKQRLIEELAAMQEEKNKKLNDLHYEGATLLVEAMRAHERESERRLQDFAKELSAQISGSQRDKLAEQKRLLANIPETFDKTMASLEKQLLEQRMTKDKLYGRMYSEISSQITKIALQKEISVVLTQVEVNIEAEDITDAVIAALTNV